MNIFIEYIKIHLKKISKEINEILNRSDSVYPLNIFIINGKDVMEFIVDYSLDNTKNMDNYGYAIEIELHKNDKNGYYKLNIDLLEISGTLLHEKSINLSANPKDYEKDLNEITKIMHEFRDKLKQLVILNNNNPDWYLTRE